MKILLLTTRITSSLKKRVKEAEAIMGSVTIDIERTKLVPDVKNSFVTHDWFQKNITDKIDTDKYSGACLHMTKREGKKAGVRSSLRGAHQKDKDTFIEMWLSLDTTEKVKFKGGDTRYTLPKSLAHEMGHGVKHNGLTTLDVHDFDYGTTINNIEGFWKEFNKKKANMTNKTEKRAGFAKVLPDTYFNNVTQPFLNPNKWYKQTGHHIGTDFGAPVGTPLYAPCDGQIYVVKDLYHAGKTIYFLATYNGERLGMRFSHLSKAMRAGNYSEGDIIGYIGNTGALTTGSHLHWDIWKTWSITRTLGKLRGRSDIEKYMIDPLSFYGVKKEVVKVVEKTYTKAQILAVINKM